ncbi:MAG: SDR family NAD(P)-dependent oxidoreductase [Thermodesulfobacteriota bacterium]
MTFDLQGKVALVTGAARGFGRFFSEVLAEAGADVICVDKDPQEETVRLIEQYGRRSLTLIVDVSRDQDIEHMADQIVKEFGRLDIAVNNAGIIHKPYRFHEIPRQEWDRLMAIDLTGVFFCMQKELELMVRQKSGVIINISSILGLKGLIPELMPRASYIAAKHAVIGLTKQAALEYAKEGIRVNAIAPGWFGGTDLARERLAGKSAEEFHEREKKIVESTPMRRRGNVEELKGLLLYLASDASSFVTGQTFVIDGGWTAF